MDVNDVESTLIDKHMNALYAKISGTKSRKPRVNPYERPIIISCMSPWVNPAEIFDLADGEAYVIRAAGNIVTQETIRSIMLAMIADRISDVIVLGHTNCTNADKMLIYKNLDKFIAKLPPRSYFRETLGTREKASKYFGLFDDEIDNIHAQVENLKFLKTIQPSLNVTGMLYNEKNGHVYTFAELGQLRKLRSQDAEADIDTLIPTRYTAYVEARKSVTSPPQTRRAEILGTGRASGSSPGRKVMKGIAGGGVVEGSKIDVPVEFAGQQLAFEKLMGAMQKSIAKLAKVRIFTPKIRMPHITGIKLSADEKTTSV